MAKDKLKITILGCGSSMGVPRPNGFFGKVDTNDKRNYRRRCSLLVQRISEHGTTNVVIDTSPDLRAQMLDAKVEHLDAVFYTHNHADHVHGIDDLRIFSLLKKQLNEKLYVYGHKATIASLKQSFRYCFYSADEKFYPAILKAVDITAGQKIEIEGKGGKLTFEALLQQHGHIYSFGYKVANLAYCIDLHRFACNYKDKLSNLDLLIVEALQEDQHASHLSLSDAINIINEVEPKRAILSAMAASMDYDTVSNNTPAHVEPGYDGLSLEFDIE